MTSGLWPSILASLNGQFWHPVGTLYTVEGTGIPDPFGPGFSGDIARGLIDVADGLWDWQPIGYEALVYPMADSVAQGRAELVSQIQRRPVGTRTVLSGYSQGAIVTGEVWSQDILADDGVLHDRVNDIEAIFQFGDPLRCPGIAHGNELTGAPTLKLLDGVTTGGIAGPTCLTKEQTPNFLYSVALFGDLYAAAPTGDDPWHKETTVGHDERIIYDAVMKFSGTDILALAHELLSLVSMPLTHLIPLVQAIWNGLTFVGAGTRAPHWQYGPYVGPIVGWMVNRGTALQAAA